MLYQGVKAARLSEWFLLMLRLYSAVLSGLRAESQHPLLFRRLFFLLFALYHRAKIPQWRCLTLFCA